MNAPLRCIELALLNKEIFKTWSSQKQHEYLGQHPFSSFAPRFGKSWVDHATIQDPKYHEKHYLRHMGLSRKYDYAAEDAAPYSEKQSKMSKLGTIHARWARAHRNMSGIRSTIKDTFSDPEGKTTAAEFARSTRMRVIILRNAEIAITKEQFEHWDSRRKQQWLQDHPESEFHKHNNAQLPAYMTGSLEVAFSVGQVVNWNSEAGHVSGRIVKVHKSPFQVSGKDGTKYTKHATEKNPVYEIVSLKTNHHAFHFGDALKAGVKGAHKVKTLGALRILVNTKVLDHD